MSVAQQAIRRRKQATLGARRIRKSLGVKLTTKNLLFGGVSKTAKKSGAK